MKQQRKPSAGHTSRTPLIARILAVSLAALFLLTLFSQIFQFAFAVEQEDIDALKQQQAEAAETLEDYNDQLAALSQEKDSAAKRYDLLTSELDYLNEQIQSSEALIAGYESEIAYQSERQATAEATMETLEDDYVQAVRAMEAQGVSAFWSVLLNATSLFDLFQSMNDLQAVTDAQLEVISQMEDAQLEAEEAQAQISALLSDQEEAQAALETQKAAVEDSLVELDVAIDEILSNEAAYAAEISLLESEQASLADEILETETALAAQQAQAAAEEAAAQAAAEEAAAQAAAEEAAAQAAAEEAAAQAAAEEAAAQAAAEEAAAQAAAEEAAAQAAAEEAAAQAAAEEAAAQAAAEEAAAQEAASSTPAESGTSSEETSSGTSSGSSSSSSSSGSSSSSSSSSSSGSSSSSSVTGSDVVAYALQFVGNPYVWGGTSLTNGCDCSGFTMQVYAHFGYSLPHYSGSQASCGVGVSYANAQEGDLICYSGHVGIYIGSGKMVSALGEKYGIVISSVNTSRIVAVRRILT
ncbi:MAG: NlpC/P60 family protein [Clostridiales bacterium]|nr:NlpC/P60 family protein [Clostridiales bacterium]